MAVAAAGPAIFGSSDTCKVHRVPSLVGIRVRSGATVGLDRRSATACRYGWLPCRVISAPGRTGGRASGRVLSTYFQRISAIVGWAFFPPGIASRGPGAMRVPDWPMVTVAGLRPGEKRRVCYNGNPARRSHLL